MDFRRSNKNQYAFKLEGFDKDWRHVGAQRHATYTNLSAGNYTFHVKAANQSGVWNTEGRSLNIHVSPPPWKSWWAYTLYALSVVAVIYLYVSSQDRQKRFLEARIKERTQDIESAKVALEEVNKKLELLSYNDPLTGIGNRRFFENLIEAEMAEVQRRYRDWQDSGTTQSPLNEDLGFFMIDIDYFKLINDTHGHGVGDMVLKDIAIILKKVCRKSDHVVRWGGEEFLILARKISADEASVLAERINQLIREHTFYNADNQALTLTCSVGFATYPFNMQPNASWQFPLDVADQALYAAKKSGRNGWVGVNLKAREAENLEDFQALRDKKVLDIQTSFSDVNHLNW